ncbi:MAG: polyphosphate kinase 1 [Bacteroidota bacterium]
MNYLDRDLSWLSFNERILQEAANPAVPLMERLKFVAIFSSNLEEFYKVRVASHRFSQRYHGDKANKFGYRPSYILDQINLTVGAQQERLGAIFFGEILPAMAQEGIHLLRDEFTESDQKRMAEHYDAHLHGNLRRWEISETERLELKNQAVYLYLIGGGKRYILQLDYARFGRFIVLPTPGKEQRVVQLDDIVRHNLEKFVPGIERVYAVKISRDAELYIDEEQDQDIVKKIRKSIRKRESGMPARLLFDGDIPFRDIDALRKKIKVDMAGLIPGGRYHNFYDFFGFPGPKDQPHLYYPKPQKVPSRRLEASKDWFAELRRGDVFLSFPYQEYHYVSEMLRRAAEDPAVTAIDITLYRVARDSKIAQALERAAQNGKRVFVLTEVQARFDEESNIYWGERLEQAGATVIYGVNALKVHAKIFAIHRKEANGTATYSYLGTGNFNEKTAGIYCDHALLSAREDFAADLREVFAVLRDPEYRPTFSRLLVAPFTLRSRFNAMIKREIRLAKAGKRGYIAVKVNSFEDLKMIDWVRKAADAGVKVDLVVRGICCYTPLTEAQRENIRVVSVVDQFLEHTRLYHFHNAGAPETYLASADWMRRNLSRRIEVAFPIDDEEVRAFLLGMIDLQLHDGLKGRIAAGDQINAFVSGENEVTAQQATFALVRKLEGQGKVAPQGQGAV